jgi:myo-inositol-1(or 4)-monophosphatase
MTETSTNDLLKFALQLAEAAGTAILPYFRADTPVDVKAAQDWDPVTEGDRAGERAMRHLIEKHHPSHGIIGEEYGTKSGTSDLTWILDPVDGTRAFVIGMPTWATLIGLYAGGKPLLGVMCQPYVDDVFYGTPEGAWARQRGAERPLKVRPTKSLSQAMAGTTSPHLYKNEMQGFDSLRNKTKSMRYGLDCYSFSLLASGQLDLAMDPSLQIYDIAALIPIMKGAGATVGSWTDNDPNQGGNVLAAATPELFEEAQKAMAA